MSEQSAAWEYKEESPLREAWKMYLQNRAAVLGLIPVSYTHLDVYKRQGQTA